MDLMRKALGDLTEILRPMDQLTLVSYADEARVLMTTRSGADKDEILTVVKDLQAGGKTSGTKGFRRSYEILRKTFVPGGNNQLIVITDGAFNPEDQADIRKLVYRSASRQFRTSTVAIRGSAFASTKLSELAELGNGSFLSLDSLDVAGDLLIGELRKQSRK
jgi:Ca-activated chloride channel family protein